MKEMMDALRAEKVETWFDLGLFLDRLRTDKSKAGISSTKNTFLKKIESGGVGFITFYYAVDGITIELEKYSAAFRSIMPNVKIHYIGGEFRPEADNIITPDKKHAIPEIDGFDNWDLYDDFFKIKLDRGSPEYNALITKYWAQTLKIVEKLGKYIEKNNIQLLYPINVNSNPGNMSLALAIVLISEYMGLPVINNCHDYYWEGGNREVDINTKKLDRGPRDFFFTNSHVGEFFSQIEVLMPWRSKSWMTVNINRGQNDHIIEQNGHNPANVSLINTAVDTEMLRTLTKRQTIKAFMQIEQMLSRYKQKLRVFTVSEILENEKRSTEPILYGANSHSDFDFTNNNIVFLQPTRVIKRKQIELDIRLIGKLFQNKEFVEMFDGNPQLHVSILVTGPIPLGQKPYYFTLLGHFEEFLDELPRKFRDRIFLGFLFSEFDCDEFKSRFDKPIGMAELYNVASLILLPSQTEGRGLPIIEATACGTPIFCRQYEPKEVYEEVIGMHLGEKDRLKVLEFKGSKIPKKLINQIKDHLFYPQEFIKETAHNKRVIDRRYSIKALKNSIEEILHRLYLQLKSINDDEKEIASYIRRYSKLNNFKNDDLKYILNSDSRHYLPGYGRIAFMLYLKSLIDPSFFRVEEMEIRGMAMKFALTLETNQPGRTDIPWEELHNYYNTVDAIFDYNKGEVDIRHDHSFSYRYRNTKYYPFHDYTHQELTGLVNYIYADKIKQYEKPVIQQSPHFFSDWDLALYQLTNSNVLAIDDRKILTKKLKEKVPKGYFPGRYISYELEFFVLQPLRAIVGLDIEEELTEVLMKKQAKSLPKVYLFQHENHTATWYSSASLEEYVKSGEDEELTLLYKHGVVKVVKSKQWCVGVHFPQMGAEALKALSEIKKDGGFLITNGGSAAFTTDIVDIDHFHIGKVEKEMSAKILGVPNGSGFIQFVPAGVRTTLAYPTPVQTSKDFDKAIKGNKYKKLAEKLGEKKLLKLLRDDAEANGTPIKAFLSQLETSLKKKKNGGSAGYRFIGGVYADGYPWSGVMATIDPKASKKKWKFVAHTSIEDPKPVTDIADDYASIHKKKAKVAWNGGYILNGELVGKLGLPDAYIGSPLGLLIIDGVMKSAPLFNKPAFIIYKDGSLAIEKVSAKNGLIVRNGKKEIEFAAAGYNKHVKGKNCFYDLFREETDITGDGNVLIRLAGNVVKEVIKTKAKEKLEQIPVGITLSIPESNFESTFWKVGKEIDIQLISTKENNWAEVSYAIEAGPALIENGKKKIDMNGEGWKTQNSIRTQAARLDYTDMRGPKIAVALTKQGKVLVLMVNGRIRESVGATHHDMADILVEQGAEVAMGFDPGGSSTLVVDGKPVNISPYNKRYEESIYSLPPEPRFVSNAILAWEE